MFKPKHTTIYNHKQLHNGPSNANMKAYGSIDNPAQQHKVGATHCSKHYFESPTFDQFSRHFCMTLSMLLMKLTTLNCPEI